MNVRFENKGKADALNVTASVISCPDGVDIVDGYVVLGDIPSSASAWSIDTFRMIADIARFGEPAQGIMWRIDYDDQRGLHHTVDSVPAFPPMRPVAEAGGSYTATEGSAVTFDSSGSSDPDWDLMLYRWDFDSDGTWDTEWSDSPVASWTWPDDWSGEVRLQVSDGQFTEFDTASVAVLNAAPTVDAGSDATTEVFTPISFAGIFSDPRVLDTDTITWDFGDGTSESGTLTPTHIYNPVREYTVRLK